MDPKFSNNGKKHRDKKHQRSERITTDLLDDEQLLMQNQHNFGRFPGESLSTSSDQLNNSSSNSKKKWKCMQCTYENWPSALKCTLCLNSKTSSQPTTYNTSPVSPTTTTTTTTTGQHVKSNRNSLKKINSLNSLKNNYNIFESTNNNSSSSNTSRKNSNLNQIEITALSHNQDSSCEEMTSVDANIGERCRH